MGTVAFPMRPSYIQINTEESKFVVSWSAIGDPATGRFEYCVRIYDVDGVCIETQLLESTYDPVLNRGSFQIDRGAYNRRRIRLENRILIDDQMSRAFTRLRLPE